MNILFVSDRIYSKDVGGAGRSFQYLIKKLSDNHNCIVLTSDDVYKKPNHISVYCFKQRFKKFGTLFSAYITSQNIVSHLRSIFKNYKIDLVITQKSVYSTPAIKYAKLNNVPTIHFIRGINELNVYEFNQFKSKIFKLKELIQSPLIKEMENLNTYNLKNADLIISNSIFISNLLSKKNISSPVIYPLIELDLFKTKTSKKYITMVYSSNYKGYNIFYKLAKQLPHYNFKVITKDIPKTTKNIIIENWNNKSCQIYKDTKILLVPSLCSETFGRVCVEAGISGIPSISSGKGGLKENSTLCIENVDDISEWALKITETENNYEKLSNETITKSKTFDANIQYEKFKQTVIEHLGLIL